jgi:CBS domain containing-hemolysin-like protein
VIRNWLRGIGRGRNGESWREAIEELIEEGDEASAPIDPSERTLLSNLIDFGELNVEDVMRPRSDIVAVEAGAPLEDVLAEVKAKGHSRMPVFRENLDDVVGLMHIRDVAGQMMAGGEFKLTALVRPILFVPHSMRVIDLLTKMRDTRVHMAVVVDEFGGTDGLVTIEDLVEEIVGEIQDEHETAPPPGLFEAPDGSYITDARTTIDELEERMSLSLALEEREDDIETLGGLVFTLAGRVPARGELIVHPNGTEFEVLEADPRRIKRLRVRRAAHRVQAG